MLDCRRRRSYYYTGATRGWRNSFKSCKTVLRRLQNARPRPRSRNRNRIMSFDPPPTRSGDERQAVGGFRANESTTFRSGPQQREAEMPVLRSMTPFSGNRGNASRTVSTGSRCCSVKVSMACVEKEPRMNVGAREAHCSDPTR